MLAGGGVTTALFFTPVVTAVGFENIFETFLKIKVPRIQPYAVTERSRQQLQSPMVSHTTVLKTIHTWIRHRAFDAAYLLIREKH
jgi:hypothetical protein